MKSLKSFILSKVISSLTILIFLLGNIIIPTNTYAEQIATPVFMPPVGSMIGASEMYTPTIINGLIINPDDPLQFSFLVDAGDANLQGEAFKEESQRLVNYFMAGLAVPEDEIWVNLSPYEKNRIVPDALGQTAMGRDLLAQDYLLKQFTASLMYPEDEMGKAFWKRIKEKVSTKHGIDDIPTNMFSKVWIVPESAKIYIHNMTVFLTDSHLKVMLEKDYLATREAVGDDVSHMETEQELLSSENVASIIRDIIIPEIEHEVNHGKNFAPLRQIFNSVILASWYKANLKESLLGQIYIDQNKIEGINDNAPATNQAIYDQYLEAFKAGVYNYVKEEYDPAAQQMVAQKYFSGGIANDFAAMVDNSKLQTVGKIMDGLDPANISDLQNSNSGSIQRVDVEVKPEEINLTTVDAAILEEISYIKALLELSFEEEGNNGDEEFIEEIMSSTSRIIDYFKGAEEKDFKSDYEETVQHLVWWLGFKLREASSPEDGLNKTIQVNFLHKGNEYEYVEKNDINRSMVRVKSDSWKKEVSPINTPSLAENISLLEVMLASSRRNLDTHVRRPVKNDVIERVRKWPLFVFENNAERRWVLDALTRRRNKDINLGSLQLDGFDAILDRIISRQLKGQKRNVTVDEKQILLNPINNRKTLYGGADISSIPILVLLSIVEEIYELKMSNEVIETTRKKMESVKDNTWNIVRKFIDEQMSEYEDHELVWSIYTKPDSDFNTETVLVIVPKKENIDREKFNRQIGILSEAIIENVNLPEGINIFKQGDKNASDKDLLIFREKEDVKFTDAESGEILEFYEGVKLRIKHAPEFFQLDGKGNQSVLSQNDREKRAVRNITRDFYLDLRVADETKDDLKRIDVHYYYGLSSGRRGVVPIYVKQDEDINNIADALLFGVQSQVNETNFYRLIFNDVRSTLVRLFDGENQKRLNQFDKIIAEAVKKGKFASEAKEKIFKWGRENQQYTDKEGLEEFLRAQYATFNIDSEIILKHLLDSDYFSQIKDIVRGFDLSADNAHLTPGGIDLNTKMLDLKLEYDGSNILPTVDPAVLKDINIKGLTPIITNVVPISNLPLMLGFGDGPGSDDSGPYTMGSVGDLSYLKSQELYK